MSQVYQVRLTGNVTQTVRASDNMRHRVELTDILTEPEMHDLLVTTLRERGWRDVHGDGKRFEHDGPSGEHLVWDLSDGHVTATIERERHVEVEIAAQGYGESNDQAQKSAQAALEQQRSRAQGQLSVSEQEMTREVSAELEASEQARVRHINEVLQRVYTDALKRKAQQLGTVVSVHEQRSGDDFELVIHIRE
jgi:hypothetical protein